MYCDCICGCLGRYDVGQKWALLVSHDLVSSCISGMCRLSVNRGGFKENGALTFCWFSFHTGQESSDVPGLISYYNNCHSILWFLVLPVCAESHILYQLMCFTLCSVLNLWKVSFNLSWQLASCIIAILFLNFFKSVSSSWRSLWREEAEL